MFIWICEETSAVTGPAAVSLFLKKLEGRNMVSVGPYQERSVQGYWGG